MSINLEREKENFKNHVATFTDYGNIKILDFKKPGSSFYRIRFLFEEDYYRLHISGDLGELTATNPNNMTYKGFSDFVHNICYFSEKIDCHSRNTYIFDEEEARKDILEMIKENGTIEEFSKKLENYFPDGRSVNDVIDDILCDFDERVGIDRNGYDILSELYDDAGEIAGNIGKVSTEILKVYMLAFELAMQQIKNK